MALGERLSAAFDIQPHLFDTYQKEKLANTIVEFNMFAKKVVPQLKVMKTAIGLYMNNSNKNIQNYKILKGMFEKYEEVNMIQYVDGNTDKLLFGNKSNDTLSSKLDHLTDNLKNPYIDLYHWIKGELYDI